MHPTALVIAYCVLVVLSSLAGGWLPTVIKLTHLRMQLTMSLVSGIMLGVAMLHMLPHSFQYTDSIMWTSGSMLAGLLVMFFLLRLFHVHHHGDMDDLEDEGHHHEHGQCAQEGRASGHELSWVGLFFGLTVHTLLDGVALAASVVAGSSHSHAPHALLGFGTFLAVLLHKPLDALSITSLMKAGGWSAQSQAMVNFAFAITCPIGAMLFLLGVSRLTGEHDMFVGVALGFSAGFFLCIALSDLLPEVAFHSHDRLKLTAALLLGIAIAIGIESMHTHESPESAHLVVRMAVISD